MKKNFFRAVGRGVWVCSLFFMGLLAGAGAANSELVNPFQQDGQVLTGAEWKLPEKCKYVRVEIIDGRGRHAWANPIVLKKIDG
jgi:hypothetical protein